MKYIYFFDEGNASLLRQLGHKGVGLAEMYQLGLPVPFGFTISSEVCNIYKSKGYIPNEIKDEMEIVNYLLNSKEILLHLQEPDSIQSYQYNFEK